jgi:hypothetical protein
VHRLSRAARVERRPQGPRGGVALALLGGGAGPLLGGTCLIVGAAEGARDDVNPLLGCACCRASCHTRRMRALLSARSPNNRS